MQLSTTARTEVTFSSKPHLQAPQRMIWSVVPMKSPSTRAAWAALQARLALLIVTPLIPRAVRQAVVGARLEGRSGPAAPQSTTT
jgi:hypothetical protein